MVFFNYSTQQMAAKVVYYGPGLGGKTSNLQYIYDHTSKNSRGEMVSLDTDTDRTLFFDLLPIDVGNIGGFETRIQLYTVPGQVFYNATRKLVLKGVDGVVFVADSQRPMLDANRESFDNLVENLRIVGLEPEDVPIVLQYNKRDLPGVLSVDELDEALNRGNWPTFEASALSGKGIFETLTAISKLTLKALRTRVGESVSRRSPAPTQRHVPATSRLALSGTFAGRRPVDRPAPGRPTDSGSSSSHSELGGRRPDPDEASASGTYDDTCEPSRECPDHRRQPGGSDRPWDRDGVGRVARRSRRSAGRRHPGSAHRPRSSRTRRQEQRRTAAGSRRFRSLGREP